MKFTEDQHAWRLRTDLARAAIGLGRWLGDRLERLGVLSTKVSSQMKVALKMATERANLSGLIQAGAPVMVRGSTNAAPMKSGISVRLTRPARVSSGLKRQARRSSPLAGWVEEREVTAVVMASGLLLNLIHDPNTVRQPVAKKESR